MKITAFLKAASLASLVVFGMGSCSKNDSSSTGSARLKVFLADDPGHYDRVVIDVRDVQINVTSDSASGWQSLGGVLPGSYNLLDLVNDHDTLLANSDIPSGRISQMRLILGTNNYVVVNGVNYALATPSAQQSGLKLNVQQSVSSGILYTILLDFDVAKSIVKTGNGSYTLKPVIRTVFNAVGGSIHGFVVPATFPTAIYVIQGNDTVASTFTGLNGGYMFRGMLAGSYNLRYVPNDTTYLSDSRNGVMVSTGAVTTVDTVRLHH